MALATRYAIRLGHRDIGYAGTVPASITHLQTPFDRRQAFMDVMASHGLEVRPEWTLRCDWTADGAAEGGTLGAAGLGEALAIGATDDTGVVVEHAATMPAMATARAMVRRAEFTESLKVQVGVWFRPKRRSGRFGQS